jgi:anaerobic dimethyl sulfoxide reductase subunit B (iron-sulfur subunit)
MQMVFRFDHSRCIGCYACVVACKDWHDMPSGPVFLRRVIIQEQGKYPEVTVNFLSIACHHCDEPACIPACPAGAITKREIDGIVIVDKELCLGSEQCGRACLIACPYEAPQFREEPNAKMQKCDLCLDRWENGQKPICVTACPMRALDVGIRDGVESKTDRSR